VKYFSPLSKSSRESDYTIQYILDLDEISTENFKMNASFVPKLGTVGDLVNDPMRDEPFYTVDLADICRKVKLWKLKLPRVTPFYAVKCNPDPAVLKLLASMQVGFDCASKNEIDIVQKETGVDGQRIIYANPCKTKSFIRHARSKGVKRMVFDNLAELDKISALYPDAELVLRIKVDDSQAVCQFSCKFGADLDAVPDLLEHAFDLGLNVIGVSFHVGSGCSDPICFAEAIFNAKWVFDHAQVIGYDMTLLDIGGGFPGVTGAEVLFDQCSRIINASLEECFPEGCGVDIIAEPGRFMVASAFTLYTTIIAKRQTSDNMFEYYLNDGVYGSFNCKVFDHVHPEPITLDDRQTTKYMSALWGPTCDSLDKVHDGVSLPEMQVGEWLVFKDMDAYTLSAGSEFNGFSKPSLKYIVSASAEAVLARTILGRELMSSLQGTQESEPLSHVELKRRIVDTLNQTLTTLDAF